MTPQQNHYAADRILRAHWREGSISQNQKQDLYNQIMSENPPENIAAAAKAMLEGKLTDDAVRALYKDSKVEDFKLDEYRAALASVTSKASAQDARLAALLNG